MTESCAHRNPPRDVLKGLATLPQSADFCLDCHQPLPGTLAEAALRVVQASPLFDDDCWGSMCVYCAQAAVIENGVGIVKHEMYCEWLNLRDALVGLGVTL